MQATERRGWLIVAVCFLTLVFIFGAGYNTSSVFFTPVLKSFGWSRERTSSLATVLALAAGLSTPIAGWLLDIIEARIVMVGGALFAAAGFFVASQAHSYAALLAAYLLIGLAIGCGTLLPCSMVIANWFQTRRGLAMGVTMSGTALGGTLLSPICNSVIERAGWRAGYLLLVAPLLLLVIPLVLIVVRTRPPGERARSVAESAAEIEGLELPQAMRGRSLWLIALLEFFYSFAVTGVNLHTVPALLGFGYSADQAAIYVSLVLAAAGFGKLGLGLSADKIGGRRSLCAGLLVMAAGTAALMAASRAPYLVLFILLYGGFSGAPLVLMPIVIVESLGLKRYGSLAGVVGIFATAGGALGPMVVGHIFDVNRSYTIAIEMCAVVLVVGALAILGCRPLARQIPELAGAPARA